MDLLLDLSFLHHHDVFFWAGDDVGEELPTDVLLANVPSSCVRCADDHWGVEDVAFE